MWTTDGDRIADFARDVDWFRPHDRFGFNGDRPPNPGLSSIFLDEDDRLWVLLKLADPDWREGVGAITDPYGRTVPGLTDRTAYYDTALEVFDSRTGALLASRRFDEYLHRFTPQGFLLGYREDEIGYPFVDVFRPLLIHGR